MHKHTHLTDTITHTHTCTHAPAACALAAGQDMGRVEGAAVRMTGHAYGASTSGGVGGATSAGGTRRGYGRKGGILKNRLTKEEEAEAEARRKRSPLQVCALPILAMQPCSRAACGDYTQLYRSYSPNVVPHLTHAAMTAAYALDNLGRLRYIILARAPIKPGTHQYTPMHVRTSYAHAQYARI